MSFPVQVVGAALVDSLGSPQKILVAQRSAPKTLAGLWEFPGGKVEPGESCQQALHRELSEELGISVSLGEEIEGPHSQGWVLHERAAMRVWLARIEDGEPAPLQDHSELRWVSLDQSLLQLAWIPADFPIVEALLARS
ncbi:(deoxy)nucleoside triphosphate pyrophosphohydrolase [uncultured Rothia sp.]|uniref:(deoxy)nucleoside triphosphate pyrophosphohydrolase n=1 Tax=uncultured Rothia sp. TaxID=316088 RepID=UPI0032172D06